MAIYSLAACTPEVRNPFIQSALIALVFALFTGFYGLFFMLLLPRLLPLGYSEEASRFMKRVVFAIGSIGLLGCGLQLVIAAWLSWQGRAYVPPCAIVSDVLNDAQHHRLLVAIVVTGIIMIASPGFTVIASVAYSILGVYARMRWPKQSLPVLTTPHPF